MVAFMVAAWITKALQPGLLFVGRKAPGTGPPAVLELRLRELSLSRIFHWFPQLGCAVWAYELNRLHEPQ